MTVGCHIWGWRSGVEKPATAGTSAGGLHCRRRVQRMLDCALCPRSSDRPGPPSSRLRAGETPRGSAGGFAPMLRGSGRGLQWPPSKEVDSGWLGLGENSRYL